MQMCTRLCKLADGSAHMHEPGVSVQSAVFICKAVCLCAAPHVHLQKRVHMCTALCSFAGLSACVHNPVFICSGPCMYALPRVYLQREVYSCRASCLSARVCACVQSRVLICTPTCTLEVRPRGEGVWENLRNLSASLKFHANHLTT